MLLCRSDNEHVDGQPNEDVWWPTCATFSPDGTTRTHTEIPPCNRGASGIRKLFHLHLELCVCLHSFEPSWSCHSCKYSDVRLSRDWSVLEVCTVQMDLYVCTLNSISKKFAFGFTFNATLPCLCYCFFLYGFVAGKDKCWNAIVCSQKSIKITFKFMHSINYCSIFINENNINSPTKAGRYTFMFYDK